MREATSKNLVIHIKIILPSKAKVEWPQASTRIYYCKIKLFCRQTQEEDDRLLILILVASFIIISMIIIIGSTACILLCFEESIEEKEEELQEIMAKLTEVDIFWS